MAVGADSIDLSRKRLCDLAGIERRLHGRWVDADLLPRRDTYGQSDLLLAGALDELHQVAGKTAAERAWPFVADALGLVLDRVVAEDGVFDVVVDVANRSSVIVDNAQTFHTALPRGRTILVVDIASRVRALALEFESYAATER